MSDNVMVNGMVTEVDCLEALQRAAERLGESPTKAQYEEIELTPASATIICGAGRQFPFLSEHHSPPTGGQRAR